MSTRDKIAGVRRRPAGLAAEEDPFQRSLTLDADDDAEDADGDDEAPEAPPAEEPSLPAARPLARGSTEADSFRRRARASLDAAAALLPVEELTPDLEGLRSQEAVVARFSADFPLLREQLSGDPGGLTGAERAQRFMEFFLHYAVRFVTVGASLGAAERKHAARAFRQALEGAGFDGIVEARSQRSGLAVAESLLTQPNARELRRRARALQWQAPEWELGPPGDSLDSPATQLFSAAVTDPLLPRVSRPAPSDERLLPQGGAGWVVGGMFVLGLGLMVLVLFIL